MPAHAAVLDIAWRMGLCGVGFGFFQAPNMKAIMANAPAARTGSASGIGIGIVATSRLIGQATGVALVAFCFTLAGHAGAHMALVAAVVVAAAGACVSLAQLVFVGNKSPIPEYPPLEQEDLPPRKLS